MSDVLNMGYFICKTVQVSLSVVNGKGSSDFGPEIEITVHGGIYNLVNV